MLRRVKSMKGFVAIATVTIAFVALSDLFSSIATADPLHTLPYPSAW